METLRSCEVLDLDSETPSWISCAPLNIARSGSRVVALEGDRYLAAIGGCADRFGRAVELFDITLGSWTLLAARLNQPRTTAAAVAIGPDQLLVVGGAQSQSSAELYKIALPGEERTQEEQSSQQVGDMPDGRMGCQAVVLNLPRPGCDYPLANMPCAVIVGGEYCEESETDFPRLKQLASVPVFDIEASSWREDKIMPQMAEARTAVALCVGIGRVVSKAADETHEHTPIHVRKGARYKSTPMGLPNAISVATTRLPADDSDDDDDDDDDYSTTSAASLWA
jgi:hypothetical protein